MEFCKAFNAQTQAGNGTITPVEVTVYEDRSFTFITKTPPAAVLIRQALGIDKGSPEPHKEKVANLTRDQLRQIAETKMPDLNANSVESAMKIIAGTARSMGVTVDARVRRTDRGQARQALSAGEVRDRHRAGLPPAGRGPA